MSTLLNSHFYHKSFTKYTSVFGSLFSNMKIIRENGKTIQVPISYSSRQQFDYFAENKKEPHIARSLPRMGFVLSNWQRDTSRLQNKNHMIMQSNYDFNSASQPSVQYNRVPFTFNYELFIATKNLDDMLQLIEHISVVFNPSVNIMIKDNDDLELDDTITVTLNSNSFEDDYSFGEDPSSKIIKTTLSFTLEGYLYMPTIQNGVIKTININYKDIDTDQLFFSDQFTEE